MFEVSVIIPVYNAEKLVRRAVISSLQFSFVKEVILIEDGSTDNSLSICKKLEENNDRVFLLQHNLGSNRGAAVSRNLGIFNSNSEYIAFLDADDYYLSNRFDEEKLVFPSNLVNCVCGYTISEFELEEQKLNYGIPVNKGVSYSGSRKDFWMFQSPTGHGGTFTTNAITINKVFLISIGVFSPSLRVSQDTELWIRLGIYGTFAYASTEPIAVRSVYSNNRSRINNRIRINRPLMYLELLNNTRGLGLESKQESLYSFFFIISVAKNLIYIRKYTLQQLILIAKEFHTSLLKVILNLKWVIKFFIKIRPLTRNV